ncbi:MAG TPA: ABC transporter permease [Vicinamibacterales bacterium]|nr:ABC transporter permease [Vicinamibacterales bacterium]
MWRRYLRFWGADPPADVDAEIDFHLEELVRHLVARGMTPEQARAEASKRFGNVARVRSECVSVDEGSMKAATRREARDALSQDIRDGFRALRGNSTFTVGAAVILALGIGFNTTVFSFNKALLFPSLPIADPPGIARMWSQNTARGILVQPLSEGDVADLFAASQSFEEIAGYAIQSVTLTGTTEPERIPALRATTNLFALLRVSPAMGRAFHTQDAANSASPVAILSDRAWRNRFGSDPSAVGQDIVLDGRPHTIVGVMPEDFWFDSKDIEVWLPRQAPRTDDGRDTRSLMAIGRLRPDASAQTAQAEMQALAQRLALEHPQTNAGWDILVTGLLPFGPGEKVFFGLVTTLTTLLLAAACAHIANLLLARGMERRGEIAIRAALGARRGRIIRQLFVESVALSLVGGVLSVLVAIPIIAEIRRVLGPRTPYLSDLSLDLATLGVTAGLALLASLLFGLAPALRLSSVTAGDALKQPPGGPISGRKKRPLASALIGLEVTVATIALIVTALYARAANNVLAVPYGFESENVVTFRLDVPEYKYRDANAAARLLTDVHQRLATLPSIKAAGAATRLPLNMGAGLPTDAITLEDRPDIPSEQSPWTITTAVMPGYFEALGIPLVQGRRFEARDVREAQPVAVVSRSMARAYWPNVDPVGRRLRLAGQETAAPWLTVIGVVEDVRPFDPTSPQVRQLYVPLAQSERALVYFVATNDAPLSRVQEVRRAVREIDADLPVLDLQPMSEVMATARSGSEFGRKSLQWNAAMAVLLALSGVYSVVAFAVSRRRREIAIRAALGGSPASLVALLLRQALRPALVGLGVGLILSALLSRAIALMLFGVNPLDPLTYTLTTIALCVAAATASCVPAIRATRASSVAALKVE